MKREFLMLAKPFTPGKDTLAGKYVSEKLDGTRVFWDGGLSRGVPLAVVPWANTTDPKTGQLKPHLPPQATGLWSRYGNPIMAPVWWLNQLPACPLDGELWAGRGSFQTLRSIVARNEPDERWRNVQFAVFGSPALRTVFCDGLIKNANFVKSFDANSIKSFVMGRLESTGLGADFKSIVDPVEFWQELCFLNTMIPSDGSSVLYLHRQSRLPLDETQAESALNDVFNRVLDNGGEGVMLREADSVWTPKRVGTLLKLKPFSDDQGKLLGFTTGRRTDKGSRLLGKIGALILDYQGKRLELSGMTDAEREFASEEMTRWAAENPGVDAPANFQARHFALGNMIEFRYRELSDGGIPKDARLHRSCGGE